jgi:hypothetical protein
MCKTTICHRFRSAQEAGKQQGTWGVSQALQKYFEPVMTMNRRVLIGGGVLGLILAAESVLALIGPPA